MKWMPMDENLRTWLWFVSVVTVMVLAPVVAAAAFLCGGLAVYRRYRGFLGEKWRAVRISVMRS